MRDLYCVKHLEEIENLFKKEEIINLFETRSEYFEIIRKMYVN